MNWFLSLIIGGLSALVGGCFSVGIASAFISWYRVSDREGASGYVLILITIAGAIASFPIGLIASRFAPGTPGFLKGLGMGIGAVAVVAGIVTLMLRLRADLPPEIDGHSLAVDFEVRCPAGFQDPRAMDEEKQGRAFAEIFAHSSKRQPEGTLDRAKAQQVDGRWVVPGTSPLRSERRDKELRVQVAEQHDILFRLKMGSPGKQHFEWSGWEAGYPTTERGWDLTKPPPSPPACFEMRFRLRKE